VEKTGGAIEEAERWVTEGSVAVSSGWRGEEWAAAVAGGGSTRKGKTTVLAKRASDFKNCQWIYRILANPGDAEGRHRAAHPGLGPWVGARVASPRCPILGPSSSSVLQTSAARQFRGATAGKTGRKRPTGTPCSAEDRVRISSRTVEGVRG
jgi:hypothetical protein